jgi:hypothetical protein
MKRRMQIAFVAAFMVLVLAAFLAGSELTEIRKAIKAKGVAWTADITSVSIRSEQERRMLLGGGPTLALPETRTVNPPSPRQYPPEIDWRNYNGKDFITPVKDQGACGSCWAFGCLGTLEALINISANSENPLIDLAEQELLSCSPGSCDGYSIYPTCEYVRDYGASEEACFPYMADDNIPCSERCTEAPFTNRKIANFDWCFTSIDGLKEYAQYGTIDVRFQVYGDFYSYAGGVYEHVWGNLEGWHHVMLLGWSDTDSCWICKNSWGENWGEHGYFRIAYTQCEIENYAIWMTPRPSRYPYVRLLNVMVHDTIYGDGDGILNPGETADITIQVKNDPGWSTAFATEGTMRTGESELYIEDSTSLYGTILGDSVAHNNADPFRISASSTITPGQCPCSLCITAIGDSGDAYWVNRPFSLAVGWEQNGWPVITGAVKTSPNIVNVSGDVRKEIVFGSDDANLYVKDYKAQDVPGFPVNIGNKIWSAPACGDIDHDGTTDISFGGFNGNVYASSGNGSVIFTVFTGGPVIATPALFDLDGDDHLEVIVGSFSKQLFVLKSDGLSYHDSFPFTSPDNAVINTGVTVCDLDGDLEREIVYGTLAGNVYALKDDATVLPGWPFHVGGQVQGAPSSADLSGSGIKVVVGSTNDSLFIINGDGTLNLAIAAGGAIHSSPSFCDIDNDNDLEIFFGCSDSMLYGYHHTGVPIAGWPFAADAPLSTSPSFSDLDNDGTPEIIIASSQGTVYVLNSSAAVLNPYPVSVSPSVTAPAVADIDLDGDNEIVLGSETGVTVIDHKSAAGQGVYWNLYRGNPYRTGYHGDCYLSVVEKEAVNYQTFTVWPNPFLSSLLIHFTVPSASQTEMTVYDITGRAIRSISVPRGQLKVAWNGKDNGGNDVPSGIYFLALRSGGIDEPKIRKIVKLR